MRVALYARVSTSDQHPETQLRELRAYCARRLRYSVADDYHHHGAWEIHKEYVDAGVSGAKDSRPALDELIHDAGGRNFETVLVWKFDRFARSVTHLLQALKYFNSMGIQFVSITEGIDTTTAMGKMVFTVAAAFAEFERDLMLERTKAGMARARAQGKHVGRPRSATAEDLRRALEEIPPGPSRRRQIAKRLKVSLTWVARRLGPGRRDGVSG